VLLKGFGFTCSLEGSLSSLGHTNAGFNPIFGQRWHQQRRMGV